MCEAANASQNLLNAKGAAATAGALHVRIVELEARALNRFDVVDFNAFQVHGAHLVNGNLQPVEIKNFIGLVRLILKRHVILKTGAASANHGDSQSDR